MKNTLKFTGLRWTRNENTICQFAHEGLGAKTECLNLGIHNVKSAQIEERMVEGKRVLSITSIDTNGNFTSVSFHINDDARLIRESDSINYEWSEPAYKL